MCTVDMYMVCRCAYGQAKCTGYACGVVVPWQREVVFVFSVVVFVFFFSFLM